MRKWLIPGVAVMALLLGGGAFAYWTLKQNRQDPQWTKISLRLPPDGEQLKKLEGEVNGRVKSDGVVLAVVKELDLARRWNLSGEAAAAAELRKRLFVRLNRNNELDIGMTGKVKERQLTQATVSRVTAKFMESVAASAPRRAE
jgi:hypothetical protein